MYVFELRRIWRQHVRYRNPLPSRKLYTPFIRNKLITSFYLFFTTWCGLGFGIFYYLTTEVDESGTTHHISIEEVRQRNRQKREQYSKELSDKREAKDADPYDDPYDA